MTGIFRIIVLTGVLALSALPSAFGDVAAQSLPFPPADALELQSPGTDDTAVPSTGYLAMSLANAVVGSVATGVNLQARREGSFSPGATTFGLAAGSASMALGVQGVLRGGPERRVGAANLAVGAASAWFAYRATTRRQDVEFGPWVEWHEVPVDRMASPSLRTGLRMTLSF